MAQRRPPACSVASRACSNAKGSITYPSRCERALVLAVFYGYTAREVSELDNTPVGTVKTRIRTALMRLRSQLGVRDER